MKIKCTNCGTEWNPEDKGYYLKEGIVECCDKCQTPKEAEGVIDAMTVKGYLAEMKKSLTS